MGAKYPHMLAREERIWDAYLEQYGTPPGRIEYDVHLGQGAAVEEEWPEWMKKMVKALSCKRADVIAETAMEVRIFEVKPRAGLSAVGQLLGYEALWFKQRGSWKPVTLVCVCEDVAPDMEDVFDYYKIEVVQVGVRP